MIPELPGILRKIATTLKHQAARETPSGNLETNLDAWHIEQAASELVEYRKLFLALGNIIINIQKRRGTMTQQSANYTRLTDYRLTDAGVEVDWKTPAKRDGTIFTFQDLAGALWDCGHCDGYSLLNGEIVCFMDGRPGFASTALPSEVWAALVGIDRQSVCLQMIFELENQSK